MDQWVSNFAFNFNLRRYTMAEAQAMVQTQRAQAMARGSFTTCTRPNERERDASACMRRQHASALAPVHSTKRYISSPCSAGLHEHSPCRVNYAGTSDIGSSGFVVNDPPAPTLTPKP
jgi:hypothetical protein